MVKQALLAMVIVLAGCGGTMSGGHSHRPEPPSVERRCPPARMQVVDLTHRLHADMPLWPGGVAFSKTLLVDYDQGYRAHKYEMGEGTGTHLDAPAHVVEGKRTLHEIPVEELVVPAVVIDVRHATADNPDYVISGDDIVDWEAGHGPIPIGSLVIIHTGWHGRFREPASYSNQDAEGVMHFPGLSADAAALLVEREVVGVGIDTLSIDPGASQGLAAHRVMLEANKYQLENLANLDALPVTGATVIVGVLPVVDGTQAQARVIALVPEKDEEDEDAPETSP